MEFIFNDGASFRLHIDGADERPSQLDPNEDLMQKMENCSQLPSPASSDQTSIQRNAAAGNQPLTITIRNSPDKPAGDERHVAIPVASPVRIGLASRGMREKIAEANGSPVDIAAGNQLPIIIHLQSPVQQAEDERPTASRDPFHIHIGPPIPYGKPIDDIASEYWRWNSQLGGIAEANGSPADIAAGKQPNIIIHLPSIQPAGDERPTAVDPLQSQSGKPTDDNASERSSNSHRGGAIARGVSEKVVKANGSPVDIAAANQPPTITHLQSPIHRAEGESPTTVLHPFPIHRAEDESPTARDPYAIKVFPSQYRRLKDDIASEKIAEANGSPVDIAVGSQPPTIINLQSSIHRAENVSPTTVIDPYSIPIFPSHYGKPKDDSASKWRSNSHLGGIIAKRASEKIAEANGVAVGNQPPTIINPQSQIHRSENESPTTVRDPYSIKVFPSGYGKPNSNHGGASEKVSEANGVAVGNQPPTIINLQSQIHRAEDESPTTVRDPYSIKVFPSGYGKPNSKHGGVSEKVSEANGNPVSGNGEEQPPMTMVRPRPHILVVMLRYVEQYCTVLVSPDAPVSMLREKLMYLQWALPQRYKLIHNYRVMDETRSFESNHVLQGDLIQVQSP